MIILRDRYFSDDDDHRKSKASQITDKVLGYGSLATGIGALGTAGGAAYHAMNAADSDISKVKGYLEIAYSPSQRDLRKKIFEDLKKNKDSFETTIDNLKGENTELNKRIEDYLKKEASETKPAEKDKLKLIREGLEKKVEDNSRDIFKTKHHKKIYKNARASKILGGTALGLGTAYGIKKAVDHHNKKDFYED